MPENCQKKPEIDAPCSFFLFSKASIFRFHVGLPRYNFNRPKSELNAAEWYWDPPTSGNKLWFEKYSDVVYHTHL